MLVVTPTRLGRYLVTLFVALLTCVEPRLATWAVAGGGETTATSPPPTSAKTRPIVETDAGGHLAAIWAIAFSADGRTLASSSDDGMVRFWDVAARKTRHIIHGERKANGEVRRIYALAATPDNVLVAIGGEIGERNGEIRLASLETGTIEKRLTGHSEAVIWLAVSGDGKHMASVSFDMTVKVWRLADGVEVFSEKHPRYPRRAVFLDARHIATAGDDGKVRIFDFADKREVRSFEAARALRGLAVSADGTLLAAGGMHDAVKVWAWTSGELVASFATTDEVSGLSFGSGRHARTLVVSSNADPYEVSLWDVSTSARRGAFKGHNNTIKAVTFAPDGERIASAGGNGNEIHIWSPDVPARPLATLASGGSTVWNVAFLRAPEDTAAGGTYIAWGFEDPCPGIPSCPEKMGKLDYALRLPDKRLPRLGEPIPLIESTRMEIEGEVRKLVVFRPRLECAGAALAREVAADNPKRFPSLVVSEGEGEAVQRRSLMTRPKSRGEDHYSYSFSPECDWIVSGGRNSVLEVLDRNGKSVADLVGHESDVPAVAVSEDGRYIVSGGKDQTVRLWNSATGELVASLIHLPSAGRGASVGPDVGEWMIFTPQGYFTSSPGAENRVRWRIGDADPTGGPQWVTASQVRDDFFRADLVEKTILLNGAAPAAEKAREEGRAVPPPIVDVVRRGLPRIKIVSPEPEAVITGGYVSLQLARQNQSAPIVRYIVYVNGVPLIEEAPLISDMPATLGEMTLSVPLREGLNEIIVRAINAAGLPTEEWIVVQHVGPGPLDKRENAYVVSIGIDTYDLIRDNNLKLAGRDAADFLSEITAQLRNTHRGQIDSRLLVSASTDPALRPTRDNILASLKFLKNAQFSDTAVLFIAGHGDNKNPALGYTLIPSDGDPNDASTLVLWKDIQQALAEVKSSVKIMFADTCRASSMFDQKIVNDAVNVGVEYFSAVGPNQDAIEPPDGTNGLFTGAVVAGLRGGPGADFDEDKALYTTELDKFIWLNVKRNSSGLQTPRLYRASGIPDYVIARFAPLP